jgi:hypothetical protein
MESLKDLEPYVDNAVSHFMEKMDKMQGRSTDLGEWLQLFAFGMSCDSF